MRNTKLRNDLRKSYNKYAQERDTYEMQDWKIAERTRYLSLLQQEHKKTLLEIGAGTGRDSKYFQDHGLETVCIDLSPAMVELCKQKGLTAYVMDMADIQLRDGSFDAIYSMNSLLHIPKAELPAILRRLNLLLKTDGLIFIGMYGGIEHEGIWEKDTYVPKRFFSFFTDEHLEEEVTKVFAILSFNPVYFEPDNPIHFQSLILKKKRSVPQKD
jgi:cyclopropane fatty-acyl-phospholipid synthase-like methyltransferase